MGITKYFIVLIIPAVLFGCGMISHKKPPEEINFVFGYRTHRAI